MLLAISCGVPISQTELLEKELNALSSNDLKRAWLEALMIDDQKMRQGQSSEIMRKQRKDSKAYKDYMQSMNDMDALNLWKIESYVKKYGHPKKSELGETAAGVLWAVVHHANTYEDRE